jgi:hypothetical protein
MQSQQLLTKSEVFKDKVLPGTKSADHRPEETPERHIHARILSENFESCLAPSHLFCGCTTFWRSTGSRREIVRNHGRNNNSPATTPASAPAARDFRTLQLPRTVHVLYRSQIRAHRSGLQLPVALEPLALSTACTRWISPGSTNPALPGISSLCLCSRAAPCCVSRRFCCPGRCFAAKQSQFREPTLPATPLISTKQPVQRPNTSRHFSDLRD